MKILLWSDYFRPYVGGTETFTSVLTQQLQEQGHQVMVIACQSQDFLPELTDYMGIPVHRFHIRRAVEQNDVQEIASIKKSISQIKREFAPDVIHMTSVGPMDLFHHLTASDLPVPYLITVQQRIPPQRLTDSGLIRRTFQKAGWTVGCSKATLAEMKALVPEISERSSSIYCGVAVSKVEPEALPVEPFQILCVGRLAPEKRFDLALRAFGQVRIKIPTARLILAGDGPLKQHLEQLATDLKIKDAVDFTGWVDPDKIPEIINEATVVLIPSAWEGLPVVAIESALMCRPVIASGICGLPEVIGHNETGLLVESGNVEELSDAVVRLLNDKEKCVRLGVQARARALKLFGVSQCVEAYTKIYQMLAS